MNIKATRLQNLRRVLDAKSLKLKDIASLLDKAPSQVSAFAGRNPTKGIGDQIARQIEKALSLHDGYLDMPFGPGPDNGCSVISHSGRKIPVLSSAEALLMAVDDEGFDLMTAREWIDPPGEVGPSAFTMAVQGVSMQPKFVDGDKVVIDPSMKPEAGDFVAVRNTSGHVLTLRQLIYEGEEAFLLAVNPDWPHRILPLSPDWCIVGRAQWNISKL